MPSENSVKLYMISKINGTEQGSYLFCVWPTVCVYNIMCLEMLMTDGQSRKTQVEIIKGWDKKQFAITIGTA